MNADCPSVPAVVARASALIAPLVAAMPDHAVARLQEDLPIMTLRVARRLWADVRGTLHVGTCTRDELSQAIDYRARTWLSALLLRSPQAFARSVLWSYRSHAAHGFSFDYFVAELAAWEDEMALLGEDGHPLRHLWHALLEHHFEWMDLSSWTDTADDVPLGGAARQLLDALLQADEMHAEELCGGAKSSDPLAIAAWWREILAPAMQRIGELWADGSIDVATEHAASALTVRLIERAGSGRARRPARHRASVTVALPPGERHELAGRMLRDCLTLAGHPVAFLGADTPCSALVQHVRQTRPRLLVLPATLIPQVVATCRVIEAVREIRPDLHVVVGGQAYAADPDFWRHTGADLCLTSVGELLVYAHAVGGPPPLA